VSTAEQARKAFSVNLVLEGQMQTFGNQVRINYSLVDPLSRRQLRADTITADYSDPFSVEDRVVDSVLAKLDLELQKQERDAMRNRGTNDSEAYESYLQGRGYLQQYDRPENLDKAITAFNQALQRDKNYAAAYAGLGQTFSRKYVETHDAFWIGKAQESCERSLTLNAKQPDGHACLGQVFTNTGKYEQAVTQYQTAVNLNPTDDGNYRSLATAFQKLNNFDEAEKIFLNAIELRPNYFENYFWLGYFYLSRGRFEDAANMYQKVTALAPDSYRGYQNLGAIYVYLGRYGEAIPELERAASIRPAWRTYSNLGTAHFYRREYDAAAHGYQQAIDLDPRNYALWMNLGDTYFWKPETRPKAAEDYRRAIELCEQALSVNPKDSAALRVLGMSQAMLNAKIAALTSIAKAIEAAPADPVNLYYAALIHAQFGEI